MDWKTFLFAFGAIFLAELGDKTQLAVMSLAAKTNSSLSVFVGAMIAFAMITIAGIWIGELLVRFVPKECIRVGAGGMFIVIGLLILLRRL